MKKAGRKKGVKNKNITKIIKNHNLKIKKDEKRYTRT
jgi:hypothetical protein